MTRFIHSAAHVLLIPIATLILSPTLASSSPILPVPGPLSFSTFLNSLLHHPSPTGSPPTEYLRHVLTSFLSTDGSHDQCLSNLPPDLRRFVETLISPGDVDWESPGFSVPSSGFSPRPRRRQEDPDLLERQQNTILNLRRQTTPVIYEDAARTKVMRVQTNLPFKNWGLSINTTPLYTFHAQTILGLQNLVGWAKVEGRKIRVAAGTHSWASLYADQGGVLVTMIPEKLAAHGPTFEELDRDSDVENGEFQKLEFQGTTDSVGGRRRALVRVGAAVTNEDFRRWQVREGWRVEANVMPLEVTFVGALTTICHGSGIQHRTISDYVRSVTYVDPHGAVQTVSDPRHLRVAAGSFGLLGLITSVVVEVVEMDYAILEPRKEPVWRAVPIPSGVSLPVDGIAAEWTLTSPAEKQKIRNNFAARAQSSGYSQWIWFPYHPDAIVLAWEPTNDPVGSIPQYPTPPDLLMQHLSTWFLNCLAEDPRFLLLSGPAQSQFLAFLSHAFVAPYSNIFPQAQRIKTTTSNAHHWRRGFSNLRVRHFEVEIPISSTTAGTPDWSIAWKAWWIAVSEVLADSAGGMRHALEMRIMSGSDVVMAPQMGNDQDGNWGTVSIEVMTTISAVDDGSWLALIRRLGPKWIELKDERGRALNVRPHLAKEWEPIRYKGLPWLSTLRSENFREPIKKFKDILSEIGQGQGWTVQDSRMRFGNGMLEELFWG